jgi:hypothetical protein
MEASAMSTPASLLYAVAWKRSDSYRTRKLYPAAAGILNLFFCATFERYLANDEAGFYLATFLILQSILYCLVSSFNFTTILSDVLTRTRIFPLTARDRFHFVLRSSMSRPLHWALVATNCFFLVIQFHDAIDGDILVVTIFLLLILNAELFLATLQSVLVRKSIPIGTVFILIGTLLFLTIVIAFVFHAQNLVLAFPPVRWTVLGILAAAHGSYTHTAMNGLWLAVLATAVYYIGRKFS